MPDSSRISLLGQLGIGYDPAALVIGDKDFEKRAGNTVDVLKHLIQRIYAMVRTITLFVAECPHVYPVYYRVYDDVGEITSKPHFDKDDTSLGQVDVLSIAPPCTVLSLKSRLLKAEDCLGDDVQLFENIGVIFPWTTPTF